MKNLKKLTAVLLTVAMITAMALVPAFAEGTSTISADATTCQTLKVLQGENGVTADYLAKPTLRYQLAIILLRLLDKEDDALAGTYTANFADASSVNADNQKILGFLKAHPELGWEGDTATGKFDPLGKVTPQMFDKVLLYTLGYSEGAGKDFEYANAVSFAGTKGLSKLAAKTELTNDDLATGLVEALKANIKGGSKTFIASLVEDTKTSLFTAAQAETAGLYSTAPTATAAVTGAKKITVTFSKAVDTTKAAITVKKGSVAVNTDSVVFADDKKSAVITATTKLTKGDYAISVSGLTETAIAVTVTAADEKVAKIDILSDNAPRVSTREFEAEVRYQVLNQYGEKLMPTDVSWTISTGEAVASENKTTGYFRIVNTGGVNAFVPGATVYITGVHAASGTVVNDSVTIGLESKADKLVFKGVYDTTKSTLVNLPAGFANNRYVLLYEVFDQYGNKMATPDNDAGTIDAATEKLVFTSNYPLFVASTSPFDEAADVTINNVVYEAVQLDQGSQADKGGTVTIQAISTATGTISSYTITADALAAPKTFTLSAPSSIIAEEESVEIPFTAIDQYGNAVTSFDALNGKVTFTPQYAGPGTSGLNLEENDDGTASLMYYAPAQAAVPNDTTDLPVYLTSLVIGGGSFSSLMVNVKEEARPTAIIGIDAAKATSIAAGNYVDIYGQDLIITDQYGRTMKDSVVNSLLDAGDLVIDVTSTTGTAIETYDDADLVTDNNALAIDDQYADGSFVRIAAIAGENPSTEVVTFKINGVASSDKAITFTKVEKSAYASFEVKDFGKMYNNADADVATNAAYNKTVVVYGVLENGTKVTLAHDDYTISTDGKLLTNNTTDVISDTTAAGSGYAAADFRDAQNNPKDVTVNVLVTVSADDGSALALLEKPLAVSSAPISVASVTFDTTGATVVTDGKATIGRAALNADAATAILAFVDEVRDQYGVLNGAGGHTATPVITISNLTKATGSTFTVQTGTNGTAAPNIDNAAQGDKFTATIKYDNYSVKIQFTVGL